MKQYEVTFAAVPERKVIVCAESKMEARNEAHYNTIAPTFDIRELPSYTWNGNNYVRQADGLIVASLQDVCRNELKPDRGQILARVYSCIILSGKHDVCEFWCMRPSAIKWIETTVVELTRVSERSDS